MNQTFKRYLISSGITFIATFAVVFGAAVADPDFEFTRASVSGALIAAVLVAARALAKAIVEGGQMLHAWAKEYFKKEPLEPSI